MGLRRLFMNRVAGSLHVLRVSYSELRRGTGEPEGSLRRVSRFMARTAADLGLDGIRQECVAVVEAPTREELQSRVEILLASLESLQTEASGEPTSILVIDDDPASVTLLETSLKDPERTILVATTVAEAREAMEGRSFDLLILDLVLPDADGRDFLLELQENPAHALVPVIVLSALNRSRVRAECLSLGASEYLQKPAEPGLLRSVVEAELRATQRRWIDASGFPDAGLSGRAVLRSVLEGFKAGDPKGKRAVSLARLEISSPGNRGEPGESPDLNRVFREAGAELASGLGESYPLATDADGRISILFPGKTAQEAAALLQKAVEGVGQRREGEGVGRRKPPRESVAGVVELSRDRDLKGGVARADRLLAQARADPEPGIRVEAPEGQRPPLRILLVEDDPVAATLVMHRLRKDNFEVVHHLDGNSAFEAACEEGAPFSLAIFDVKLPGMDGFELLQRVRELPHFSETPVIMLTAMGREADILRAFELGAQDYVVKPFSPPELQARIHRVLGE